MSSFHANIIDIETSIGSKIVTNKDLEKLVDTNDQWIIERTGIKSRPICDSNEDILSLSIDAATKVLERNPVKIDAVVAATATPTHVFPNLSNQIAAHFNITGPSFDISAACSGYLYGLTLVSNMLDAQKDLNNILFISSDTLSRAVDWKDRNTCILFGDAGSATLVSKQPQEKKYLSSIMKTSHDKDFDLNLVNGALNRPKGFISMNGKKVFKNAVSQMSENIKILLEKENLDREDIAKVVPHQANQRIIDAVTQKLDISSQKVFSCIEHFGNTSAASIPLALKKLSSQEQFSENQYIMMSSFGAGFTSASMLWRITKDQKVFNIKEV